MKDSQGEKYKRRLASRVVHMYYVDGMSQKQISADIGVSLSTISRLLSYAKDIGIVKIVINDVDDNLSKLEMQLERKYGLKRCLVTNNYASKNLRYEEMGHLISGLLVQYLDKKDCIGIGWGVTLKGVTDHLVVDRALDLTIIPSIGAMGNIETGIYPNSIAAKMAYQLGSRSYLVNFPHVLATKAARQIIEQDRNFQSIKKMWGSLRCLIISNSDLNNSCSLASYGVLNENELENLRNQSICYTSNGHYLNKQGKLRNPDIVEQMLRMEMSDILSTEYVIQVVTGYEKVAPTHAAICAGIGNILVTDSALASKLLNYGDCSNLSRGA